MYPSLPVPSTGYTSIQILMETDEGCILSSMFCLVSQGEELSRTARPRLLTSYPPPMVTSSCSPLNEGSLSGWRQPKTLGNKRAGTREKKGSLWRLPMPGTRYSQAGGGGCLNLRPLAPSLADEIQSQAAAFRGFT